MTSPTPQIRHLACLVLDSLPILSCLSFIRYEAGAKEYDLPVIAQVPILFATLGFLETKRLQGWKETGTVRSSVAGERLEGLKGAKP